MTDKSNMKLSHKHNLTTLISAVLIFNFSSCKYEDGPKISLKSKKARLVGEWEAVTFGDEDLDELSVEMEFEKDGDFRIDFTYEYYGYSYTYKMKGEWSWEDNKETIDIDFEDDNIELAIKRLTNKEFWAEDSYDDEWEFEKK